MVPAARAEPEGAPEPEGREARWTPRTDQAEAEADAAMASPAPVEREASTVAEAAARAVGTTAITPDQAVREVTDF